MPRPHVIPFTKRKDLVREEKISHAPLAQLTYCLTSVAVPSMLNCYLLNMGFELKAERFLSRSLPLFSEVKISKIIY